VTVSGFQDIDLDAVDYDNLPPLIPKGEDREAILERIVAGWCTATGIDPEEDLEGHIDAGGYCVERVRFWDANTEEPVDLGDLLRRVEERLRSEGEPKEFKDRPDLETLIRACAIPRCDAGECIVRPRFSTYGVRFGDSADFSFAQFGGSASFDDAQFGDSARFAHAQFGDSARFDGAQFGDSARFDSAQFGDSASFDVAQFGDSARFSYAEFGERPSFAYARLPLATFRDARLGNANFDEAQLERADVRGATGLLFDGTYVRDIRIEADAPDPWSVLRRTYSGPRYFVHLLLLVAFFTPYVAKGLYYTYLSGFQETLLARFADLRSEIERMPGLHGAVFEAPFDDRLAAVRARLRGEIETARLDPALRDRLTSIVSNWPASQPASAPARGSPRALGPPDVAALTVALEQAFYEHNRAEPAFWRFVTGGLGVYGLGMAAIAILYNVLRLLLTLRVSYLREAEDRSSVTPRLVEYYGQCHPRANEVEFGRSWWRALWLWCRESFITSRRAPRESDERVSWRAWPDWLTRLPENDWRKRSLRWLRLGEDDCRRPFSFLECVGLYRVHLVTSVLLWVTLLVTLWNLTWWIGSTWIWVPIGAVQ
jgi:uncharacterized protein YjbI with pentapeptide repeats